MNPKNHENRATNQSSIEGPSKYQSDIGKVLLESITDEEIEACKAANMPAEEVNVESREDIDAETAAMIYYIDEAVDHRLGADDEKYPLNRKTYEELVSLCRARGELCPDDAGSYFRRVVLAKFELKPEGSYAETKLIKNLAKLTRNDPDYFEFVSDSLVELDPEMRGSLLRRQEYRADITNIRAPKDYEAHVMYPDMVDRYNSFMTGRDLEETEKPYTWFVAMGGRKYFQPVTPDSLRRPDTPEGIARMAANVERVRLERLAQEELSAVQIAAMADYFDEVPEMPTLQEDEKRYYSDASKGAVVSGLKLLSSGNQNAATMYRYLLERSAGAQGRLGEIEDKERAYARQVPNSAFSALASALAGQINEARVSAGQEPHSPIEKTEAEVLPISCERIMEALAMISSGTDNSECIQQLRDIVASLGDRSLSYMTEKLNAQTASGRSPNTTGSNTGIPAIRGQGSDYWKRHEPGFGKIT